MEVRKFGEMHVAQSVGFGPVQVLQLGSQLSQVASESRGYSPMLQVTTHVLGPDSKYRGNKQVRQFQEAAPLHVLQVVWHCEH